MEYLVQASTTKGTVKETNQDSMLVRQCRTSRGNVLFAVMCDGMGGLSCGELASASLIRAFENWILTRFPYMSSREIEDFEIREEWTKLIMDVNEKLRQYGKKEGFDLGTTISGILLTDSRYYIVQVGDSRVYRISNEAERLTIDQSWVWEQYLKGVMTKEEAENDPRRNILTECVGVNEQVSVQFQFGKPTPNQVYMLCCDGFYHELMEQELIEYMNPQAASSEEVMQQNLDYLIHLCMQRGENDNISSILIRTC